MRNSFTLFVLVVLTAQAGEILDSVCTTPYNYFQKAWVGFVEHTLGTLNAAPTSAGA